MVNSTGTRTRDAAAGLAARRHAAVSAFLDDRGIDPSWLDEFVRERVGDGVLLVTSSPVHGLANATSDLDLIRIQRDALSGARIAAKIFERGHHLEVVSFSEAEVEDAVARLRGLVAAPPAATVAGLRGWDRNREPRRKQTERIINGVTLDGAMPYAEHLPVLGAAWSRAALQSAVEHATCMCLAEAAGEWRGRVGYGFNALLHLMDALLSAHGDVYTTRKWYLLRWVRFVAQDRWQDARSRSAGRTVERLRTRLAAALHAAGDMRLAEDFVAAVGEVARAIDLAQDITVQVVLGDDAEHHEFLPGWGLLICAGSSVLVAGGLDMAAARPTPLSGMPAAGHDEATSALHALRARVGRLDVAYDAGTNA